VAQAVQRVVHARRGEQRQRLRLAGAAPGAVGDAVVHGRQVGQVEHIAHQHAALGAELAFDMVVLGKREVDGMGWVLVPTSSSTPWLRSRRNCSGSSWQTGRAG
jgi:hypothetical protein